MKLTTDFILSAAKDATKYKRDKTFTVDDIRKFADREWMDVKPNSWGMAFMRAYTQGRIKPVKMSRSSRESNHGRRVNVWRLS
jgi:hypothetical protein